MRVDQTGIRRSVRRLAWWAALVLGLAAIGVFAIRPWAVSVRQKTVTAALLASPDPSDRAAGAWRIVEHEDRSFIPILVQRVMGDEHDAHAREAAVYALGKLADRAGLPAAVYAIDLDDDGFVRASAWLALARMDPQEFRRQVELGRGRQADAWDEIGTAQGLLELGDAHRVDRLLHWASAGDDAQRYLASQGLHKHVRPLLEAAGRWPVNAVTRDGETWSPKFVAEIAGRAAGIDLVLLAQDTKMHARRADGLRTTLRRVTTARERLARWLFRE